MSLTQKRTSINAYQEFEVARLQVRLSDKFLEGQFEVTEFKSQNRIFLWSKLLLFKMSGLSIKVVETQVFPGQKPGTSGLRKKVAEFLQEHYMENFIQCTLEAMGQDLPGSTLVVGGDGRYGVPLAVDKIIKMSAANQVSKLIVAKDGIMSTPALSNVIRKAKTTGGIILTASHNPGGENGGDFGIKFNCANGGPAPTDFTDKIYQLSTTLKTYKICPDLTCDFTKVGNHVFQVNDKDFSVDVIDSIDDYVEMMKGIFDFPLIKDHLKNVKVLINSMHGVTGPYVERIFGTELGAPQDSFLKTTILPDFGGGHPDPNLTYAADLVQVMADSDYAFGAAFDGDGDRNMILGAQAFFVTPCDSLAVIANNLECIPYFQKNPAHGYARSMPTSAALDRVAQAKGKECFETPTGWKFFGNLLDAGRIALCGEESFGTGSDHIREKDGIWAALAWLQILASKKQSVEQVLKDHWSTYGRNFFTRYDYENCESGPCQDMIDELQKFVDDLGNIGKTYTSSSGKSFTISKMDNFQYTDPIDQSVTKNQGLRIFFQDGSRIVMRLSGTGSSGATVRMYVDTYESEAANQLKSAADMLAPCIDVALQISQLPKFTGRNEPTVIT